MVLVFNVSSTRIVLQDHISNIQTNLRISGNEFVTFDSVSAVAYSGNRTSHVIKYKIDGMIK